VSFSGSKVTGTTPVRWALTPPCRPQSKFPVQEGILNYRGTNTVAIALWVMTPNVTIAPELELTLDNVYEGGVGNVQVNNPVWSPLGRQ